MLGRRGGGKIKGETGLLIIAWVPFLSTCSGRKGKTLGLGDACFGEHVAPPFRSPESELQDKLYGLVTDQEH